MIFQLYNQAGTGERKTWEEIGKTKKRGNPRVKATGKGIQEKRIMRSLDVKPDVRTRPPLRYGLYNKMLTSPAGYRIIVTG